MSKLMEEFNVGQSTIYDIKKQPKDLKQYLTDGETKNINETCSETIGWSAV